MNKTLGVATLGAIVLLNSSIAFVAAKDGGSSNGSRQEVRQEIKELREKVKQKREELKEKRKTGSGSMMHHDMDHKSGSGSMMGKDRKTGSGAMLRNQKVNIMDATITSISGMQLMISTKRGKTSTVNTGSGTTIVRRFGGASSFSELMVGHRIDVRGTQTGSGAVIEAKMIRDRSIQKRNGAVEGTIVSTGTGSIVVSTRGRGMITITVDANTTYQGKKKNAITFADLMVGDKVVAKGLLDRELHTLTGVKVVVDKNK